MRFVNLHIVAKKRIGPLVGGTIFRTCAGLFTLSREAKFFTSFERAVFRDETGVYMGALSIT
jgi:hypothetical protein